MAWKRRSSGAPARVPLGQADLWINRGIGIFTLVVGAAVVYSLAFSFFDVRVQYQWEINEDGERTPLTAITCPPPWSVVIDGAKPDGVVSGDVCVMPSRALIAEAGIVVLLTLALASWMFTRTKRPAPLQRLPLPIRQPERERLP